MIEFVNAYGFLRGGASPEFLVGAGGRGQAGGCSNPPTCSLNNAIAWPAGHLVAEGFRPVGATLHIIGSHLDAFDGTGQAPVGAGISGAL